MNQSPDELLGQLRGVTGPEATPPAAGAPIELWIALGTIVAAQMAFLFWLRRRRRVRPAPPADVEALNAMARLTTVPNASALTGLNHICRKYLGRVHQLAAQRLTTGELLSALPADAAGRWTDVFEFIDKARFAGVALTQSAWSELLQRSTALIQADCESPADR